MEFQQVTINENQFALTTYNGLKVIVSEKDGYYNATNLCKQCGKEFFHYKETKEWDAQKGEYRFTNFRCCPTARNAGVFHCLVLDRKESGIDVLDGFLTGI